jgi:hypothetical protein
MYDLAKILIDEPEKIKKLGFLLLKFILNLIFASFLYQWTIGEYTLIDFTNPDQWLDYLISGRILICVFLYFTSEILLFEILTIFTVAPLDFFVIRISRTDFTTDVNGFIRWVLGLFNVVQVDNKTQKVTAGKNTNEFLEFLEEYSKKESQEEITTIKNSLANKVYHTSVVIAIVYFSMVTVEPSNNFIPIILIAGCVILALLYFSASILVITLEKNKEILKYQVARLKFEKILIDTIAANGIPIREQKLSEDTGTEKLIDYRGKTYILRFYFGVRPLNEFTMKLNCDLLIKAEQKMLLITNKPLTEAAKEMANDYRNSLTVIQYENETELQENIEKHFKQR